MSALVIFLGSFLSFALEPMVGRALLPVFGGAPTVWVTCLAAFQLLMVAGYGYAGFAAKSGSVGRMRLHLALLGLAAAWCAAVAFTKIPILATLSEATGIPALDVFICVLALCALTFVLLSANATLVQSVSGGNYRLYSVSNLGSLIGLFFYPLFVEPFVGLTAQWLGLAAAIAVYAALLFLCARSGSGKRSKSEKADDHHRSTSNLQPSTSIFLYFILPAITAALLNATTAHLTLDIAPVPLIWVVPLGLFLVSYIIGFSGWSRPVYWVIPAAIAASLSLALYLFVIDQIFWVRLICYSSALFLSATFIHSWLYAIRPPSAGLPRYYLLNVLGGAAGGLLTSMVAPVVFDTVLEFPLTVILSAIVFILWAFLATGWKMRAVVLASLAVTFCLQLPRAGSRFSGLSETQKVIYRSRGFFGTMNVIEDKAVNPSGRPDTVHGFTHGNTVHGVEFTSREFERMPTAYYTPYACGHAIVGHPAYGFAEYTAKTNARPMRVCLVGMGMGTCFAYARTNDFYRAYEISPEVAAIARNRKLFAFVSSCRSTPDIRIMDARKGLEAEAAANEEKYDVILVDAFTGDSVPYHLSTKEAIALYLNRLKPDGILCIHCSNLYLDLRPYAVSLAKEFGLRSLFYGSLEDDRRLGCVTDVAIFLAKDATIAPLPLRSGMCKQFSFDEIKPLTPFPTDERGSLLPLIGFGGR